MLGDLKEILEKHIKWLRNEDGGQRANLQGANLQGANLKDADLQRADLRWANLQGVDLRWANLQGVDLKDADLRYADLQGANLKDADLQRADLQRADLRYADLQDANIDTELLNRFYPIACPEVGSFIAWKACALKTIVKLQVLEDAHRSSAFTRKCRCSAAKVLSIENIDGTPFAGDSIASRYNPEFIYKIGEIVKVDDFDLDRKNECAPGIHFFLTRQEAVDWANYL